MVVKKLEIKPSSQPGGKLKKHLGLLSEVSAKLQSLLEIEDFYQETVSILQDHFHYYAVQIWTVHGSEARIRAQAGAYSQHLRLGDALLLSESGILGRVVESQQTYLTNDVEQDPNFTNLSLPVDSKSELCVPIVKQGVVLGTINVESNQDQAFDSLDQATLESVASQIGVAITNRRLFDEARDFNVRLRRAVDDKTTELKQAHERILSQQKLLQQENKALRNQLDRKPTEHLVTVGQSPAILNILRMVDKIAPTTATVLIEGESGTGKELIARRLSRKSERCAKPFVTLNCGALQETLLESELFGHERGAFTGAVTQKLGLVETANGGTLFLDEIGELSPSIQAKLLRFLQEGEFYRLGGKRKFKVDVRVVSATNRNLEQEVQENNFREDLYYRLNTITLKMPPLRKRREDIPMLVDFFLQGSRIKKVDPKVMQAFCNYHWPGNIRELQNTLERLKILADGSAIKLQDLPMSLRVPKTTSGLDQFQVHRLDEVERNHILKTLAYFQGNKTRTAEALGVTIKTLYNKLHRYGYIQQQQGLTRAQIKDSNKDERKTQS